MPTELPSTEGRDLQAAVQQALRNHSTLYLVEGVILVILGLLAVLAPMIASLFVAVFLGWLFLVSGGVGLAMTFLTRGAPGFWWSLLSAVLAIVVGGLLIARPVSGVLSLTYVLIVFFVVEGVATIMYAVEHRGQYPGRWGWMLVSGIVDVILAAIIVMGLPETATWAIGLLVGINMVFGGFALISLALYARSATSS
ncbi:MAG: HdeD family acid-resistance protein [Xanthobacteraceae bacterium]